MTVGSERTVILEPADAFGKYDDKAVMEVESDRLPKEAVIGSILGLGQQGQQATVTALDRGEGGKAKLDMNHPLAGKQIEFWV
jgi:FKBP-type peptidyl-prolyl cis-trans isomerase 2